MGAQGQEISKLMNLIDGNNVEIAATLCFVWKVSTVDTVQIRSVPTTVHSASKRATKVTLLLTAGTPHAT